MQKLGDYIDGNVHVILYDNGTRIQETINPNDKKFIYKFPLNFDICITKYCNANCSYCYENASINGKHGNILNLNFIDSLVPGTEIAIGGGNALDHPDLLPFLYKLKEKGVIPNITINQKHIKSNYNKLKDMLDKKLIYGLGVSLADSSDIETFKLIDTLGDNVVIHIICGIFSENDTEILRNRKVLILGYKDLGRGHILLFKNKEKISNNIKWLKNNISKLKKVFSVTSFDCLALKQLSIKNSISISDNKWNILFQGDDFTEESSTMYIDAVDMKVARTSTQLINERVSFTNESISELFSISKGCLRNEICN